MIRGLALVAALLLAACAGPYPPGGGMPLGSSNLITLEASSYGSLSLTTTPGAQCTVTVTTPLGRLSDGPPATASGQADASGKLTLAYTAPRVPAGNGSHVVTCAGERGIGSLQSPFVISNGGLSAKKFTVRVVGSAVPADEKSVREEPALVPLRDAAVQKLNASLVGSWKDATRGLATLTLVPANADIVIKVIAGRAQSVHRTAPDTSEDVLIYAADQTGEQRALENIVAVALHELGHVWCCRGPGTIDGHWAVQEESPGLLGVDRFGLMNHPVNCLVVPSGFLSCPNRFSDRELRTMGFETLPAPVADPCVLQRDAIMGQMSGLKSQLDPLKAQIDAQNAQLEQYALQIKAIESQYPSRVLPPDVYARHANLVNLHNALLRDTQQQVDTYNAIRDRYNALAAQRNTLPC